METHFKSVKKSGISGYKIKLQNECKELITIKLVVKLSFKMYFKYINI